MIDLVVIAAASVGATVIVVRPASLLFGVGNRDTAGVARLAEAAIADRGGGRI